MHTSHHTADEQADSLVGQTIGGRYHLAALLGHGGSCSVYRAADLREQKPRAVKVLPAARALDPELAARFRREATTGRRIVHPNVVAISDSGELADGSSYLVMEFLEGGTLEALLQDGPIAVGRAIALMSQLLEGLEAAHKLGIAHRDVKPENVLFADAARLGQIKLADFGIASNDRAAIKLTAAGVAFGTPEYISPEMAMGLSVDPRADLYSAGIVLYEMVTGRLPFAGSNPKQLLKAQVSQTPPSPRTIAPAAAIPIALEKIILRALAKLPDERFPSATAMREALAAVAVATERRRARKIWLVLIVVLAVSAAAAWHQFSPRLAPVKDTIAPSLHMVPALPSQRPKGPPRER